VTSLRQSQPFLDQCSSSVAVSWVYDLFSVHNEMFTSTELNHATV
jgi:hypothetical protein